jgi:hypothetical protein
MELWHQERKDQEYDDEDDFDKYDEELDGEDDDEWEDLLDQMSKYEDEDEDLSPVDYGSNNGTNKKSREGVTSYKNTARLLKGSKSGGAYSDDDYYGYRQGKGKGKGGGYPSNNGGKGKGKGGGYSGYDNGGKGKGKGKGKGGGYDDYYYGKGKNLKQVFVVWCYNW